MTFFKQLYLLCFVEARAFVSLHTYPSLYSIFIFLLNVKKLLILGKLICFNLKSTTLSFQSIIHFGRYMSSHDFIFYKKYLVYWRVWVLYINYSYSPFPNNIWDFSDVPEHNKKIGLPIFILFSWVSDRKIVSPSKKEKKNSLHKLEYEYIIEPIQYKVK
jgi:hypothetical protein